MSDRTTSRRLFLVGAGTFGLIVIAAGAAFAEEPAPRRYRIGVLSASIRGKPQKVNGHTWHFCHFFHPEINFEAIRKYVDPANVAYFDHHRRQGLDNFDLIPFSDTRITHI